MNYIQICKYLIQKNRLKKNIQVIIKMTLKNRSKNPELENSLILSYFRKFWKASKVAHIRNPPEREIIIPFMKI